MATNHTVNTPRVVVGVPLFNNAEHLPQALESLLAQTYAEIAFVLLDDRSSDATSEVSARYATLDHRISFEVNERRLGLVANSRLAFERARELHPSLEYFAWGSDHDVWHPRWAASLVRVLDESPEAVAAYPLNIGISDDGDVMRQPWRFETHGLRSPWTRLRASCLEMAAGNMVYGLFRAEALERCGVLHHVLLPDRLLLSELSLHGEFRQVPATLWQRRFRAGVRPSLARQRASFFPDRVPLHSHVPWLLTHTAVLFWSLVVLRRGPAGFGRVRGLGATALYFVHASQFRFARRLRYLRKAFSRARKHAAKSRNPAVRALTHLRRRRHARRKLAASSDYAATLPRPK